MKPIIIFVLVFPIVTIGVTIYVVNAMMKRFRCPACGSRKHSRVSNTAEKESAAAELFEWKDFRCKECATVYAATPPNLFKAAPILVGVAAIGMAAYFHISPDWKLTFIGYFAYLGGAILIVQGIRKLRKKNCGERDQEGQGD